MTGFLAARRSRRPDLLPLPRKSRERVGDERLGLSLNALQVLAAAKALRVQLVDRFGARWPGCEPTVGGAHFETAERRTVARGTRELRLNWISGELSGTQIARSEAQQRGLLCAAGRRIDALVGRRAQLPGEILVQLRRIASGTRHDLGGQ